MLLFLLGAVVVIAGLLFVMKTNLSLDGSNLFSTFTSSGSNTTNGVDRTKIYQATIDTSEGSFVVTMNPNDAPNLIAQFESLAKSGFYNNSKVSSIDESVGIYMGLNEGGTDSSASINESMNAIDLGLNDEKVSSITSQLILHNEGKYRQQDVDSNSSMTLKEFNEKFLGIKYSSDVSSFRIKKYSLVAKTTGNNGLRSEFLITTTNDNRYLDGRRVHFGDVTSGTDVIDKMLSKSANNITIKSISVTAK